MYDNSIGGHYSPCRGNIISCIASVREDNAH